MKAYKVKKGCWIWQKGVSNKGYGLVHIKSKGYMAARYYYEEKHGKLPIMTQLIHMCREKLCVKPEHMKPQKSKTIPLYGATR